MHDLNAGVWVKIETHFREQFEFHLLSKGVKSLSSKLTYKYCRTLCGFDQLIKAGSDCP